MHVINKNFIAESLLYSMKLDTLLECFCALIAGVIVSGFWLMHWLVFCTRYVFFAFFFFSLIFSARIIVVRYYLITPFPEIISGSLPVLDEVNYGIGV